MSGATLTQRIRAQAFASLLRQEFAYFDQPENTSGAICTRLCSDALSVQQLVSARLGLICEAIATFLACIIFGFSFSWQLTLIVLFSLFITTTVAYLNIRQEIKVHSRVSAIIGQASSVRTRAHFLIKRFIELFIELHFNSLR